MTSEYCYILVSQDHILKVIYGRDLQETNSHFQCGCKIINFLYTVGLQITDWSGIQTV